MKDYGIEVEMAVLKRSRKHPQVGELFAYKLKDCDAYGFGRVVCSDACVSSLQRDRNDVLVLFLYDALSPDITLVPELSHERLLLEPIATNRLAWSHGHFKTIGCRPLEPHCVYERLCFEDFYADPPRRFRDPYGRWLPNGGEPCGRWCLTGYGAIARMIWHRLILRWNGCGDNTSNDSIVQQVDCSRLPAATSVALYCPLRDGPFGSFTERTSMQEFGKFLDGALRRDDYGHVVHAMIGGGVTSQICAGPNQGRLARAIVDLARVKGLAPGGYVAWRNGNTVRRVDI